MYLFEFTKIFGNKKLKQITAMDNIQRHIYQGKNTNKL